MITFSEQDRFLFYILVYFTESWLLPFLLDYISCWLLGALVICWLNLLFFTIIIKILQSRFYN